MRSKLITSLALVAAIAVFTPGAGAAPLPVASTGEPTQVLDRPVERLHAAIDDHLERVEAERQAARERRRRLARQRQRELYANLPGSVSRETLEAIAACESGGDPEIVSSTGTYRGKYQFSFSTWASVGGSGDPAAAPEQEQDYRAALLYERSGPAPWPHCGQ